MIIKNNLENLSNLRCFMKLKEETIKEINQLPPEELIRVYDFIQFIKKEQIKGGTKERPPYLRSREILRKCEGSLADDIINGRKERV